MCADADANARLASYVWLPDIDRRAFIATHRIATYYASVDHSDNLSVTPRLTNRLR